MKVIQILFLILMLFSSSFLFGSRKLVTLSPHINLGSSGLTGGLLLYYPQNWNSNLGMTFDIALQSLTFPVYNIANSGVNGTLSCIMPSIGLGFKYYLLDFLYASAKLNGGYIYLFDRRWNSSYYNNIESIIYNQFMVWPSVNIGLDLKYIQVGASADLFAYDNMQAGIFLSLAFEFNMKSENYFSGLTQTEARTTDPVYDDTEASARPLEKITSITEPVSPDINNTPSSYSVSDTIVLIIGNQRYPASVPQHEYASRDCIAFSNMITLSSSIPEENMIYLNDLTLSQMKDLFGSGSTDEGQLYQRMKLGKYRLILFYSGHGAPGTKDGNAYILPSDGDIDAIEKTAFPLDTLLSSIARLHEKGSLMKSLMVFESSFSGGSGGGKLLYDSYPVSVKPDNPLLGIKDATLILAASAGETASWYREKQNSLFSWFLIQGLQGKADLNSDGSVTSGELRSYLDQTVPPLALKQVLLEQHPLVYSQDDTSILFPVR